MKKHLLHFALILGFNIICSLVGYGVGYSDGESKVPQACQYVKGSHGAPDLSN